MNTRDNINISKIIYNYLLGNLSKEEEGVLQNWLKDDDNRRFLEEMQESHRLGHGIERMRQFKDRGLEIISISTDQNKFEWIKAMEVEKMNWVNLIDSKELGENSAASGFFIQKIPTIYSG